MTFVPDPAKTPALRAGTVDRQHPYRCIDWLVINIQVCGFHASKLANVEERFNALVLAICFEYTKRSLMLCRFDMPPTWHEARVANTQSGNYCQPRCAEPWTEVVFENDKEGRIEVHNYVFV